MLLKLNLPLDSVAEPDDETKTLVDAIFRLYRHFAENTNLHGCLRTAIRTPFRRTVWSIMLLAVIGWSVYTFHSILQDFYSYPFTSVITINNDRTLLFPAVTICNVNRLRRSLVTDTFKKEMEAILMQDDVSDSKLMLSINELLRRTSRDDRKKAWHNISDMLIDCSFNTKQCSDGNFSIVEGTIYGNCYTFNYDKDTPLSTTKAGPQYGLVLELTVQQDEYLPLTNTAGFKVIIHDPGEPPFPEDGGILVRPGAETSIGLGLTKTDRLPEPYGACVEEKGSSTESLYADWNFKYTQNGCKKSCYQLALFRHCNCCDSDLPCNNDTIIRLLEGTPQNKIRFCETSAKDINCIANVEQMYINDSVKCPEKCPPPCQQNVYATYISSGAWPADSYFDVFLKKIGASSNISTSTSRDNMLDIVRKNYLRLEIYYNNLDYTEYVTSPTYTWNKVVGDIGGQMGLWMGFSILAGMEAVELFLDSFITVLVYLYQKLLNREIKAPNREVQVSKF